MPAAPCAESPNRAAPTRSRWKKQERARVDDAADRQPSGAARDRAPIQLLEQRTGGDEIRRVEAFREPGIDWRENVARGARLAGPRPQLGDVGRGSQLPQLCALLARERQAGLQEAHRPFQVARTEAGLQADD